MTDLVAPARLGMPNHDAIKVVFADFDGVLNSHEWARRQPRGSATMTLDPAAVGLLNQLVLRTGAKVVISSTWRLFPEERALVALRAAGFVGGVLGQTPDGAFMQGAIYGAVVRGHEIQAWLDETPWFDAVVGSFVILDDDQDMAHLAHRLVRTNHAVGLTQADVDKAVEMLGGVVTRLYTPEDT